jgi:hypothetical protein
MQEYAFKVKLVAVVRVRAEDESLARQVVPSVLGAPGIVDIQLANDNNAAIGRNGTVPMLHFPLAASLPSFEVDGKRGMQVGGSAGW